MSIQLNTLIDQVNQQADTNQLLSSAIGTSKGIRKRPSSIIGCIWAWLTGPSLNKNRVAKSINAVCQNIDWSETQISDDKLSAFLKNLEKLEKKFSKKKKSYHQSLNRTINKIKEYIHQKEAISPSPAESIPDHDSGYQDSESELSLSNLSLYSETLESHHELESDSEVSHLSQTTNLQPNKSTNEETVLVTGSKNQFDNNERIRESCSGTTLAFLDRSLYKGQKDISSDVIDQILKNGLDIYQKGMLAKQETCRHLQNAGIRTTDALSTQLHPYDLLRYVTNGLITKPSRQSSQVRNKQELRRTISDAISLSLSHISKDQSRQSVGMTITFNGKTFALNMEVNHGKVSYMFFDSHGTAISNHKAYTFRTEVLGEILDIISSTTEFISREIQPSLRDVLTEQEIRTISQPQDGDNELGFFTVTTRN